MVKRILLAAIFALPVVACATAPEGDEKEKDDKKDGVHCTVERDMGSRVPVEVCR